MSERPEEPRSAVTMPHEQGYLLLGLRAEDVEAIAEAVVSRLRGTPARDVPILPDPPLRP